MTLAEWLGAIGGLLLAVLAWSWFVFAGGRGRAGADSLQERRVRVRGGYEPSEIHVRAGVPTRLVFRREETAPCSERVVFPDLGISATLPAFRDIAVQLPASEPGTHPFTCEMEMLHGSLVVESSAAHGPASRQDIGGSGAMNTAAAHPGGRRPANQAPNTYQGGSR
jgi:Cu+-exporting ATPase